MEDSKDGRMIAWEDRPSNPRANPMPDDTLDDPHQVIVDLQRELAARTAERDEALAREAAAAEVLQVINSSPGDLAPVFDAMLEKAMHLCEAAFGILWIYDGGRLNAVAMRGVPGAFVDFAREPLRPGPETGLGRLLRGERFIHITDISADEVYRSGDRLRVATVELGGARTLLLVPLRKDDALLGIVSVYRQEVRPFTDKQIALLQNFAAQAVIAMENARLLGELRKRTEDLEEALEYQTATSDVLKVISRTEARLEAALETLVGTAARICAADQGAIHQLRDGLHFVSASFGTNLAYRDYVARNPIVPGRGTAIGRMALEGGVVHIEDVLGDPEYTGSEFQRLAGFRTVLAVPLFREDVVIGSILLTRSRVERFTDKQIELVRTFADQAVIAIENTRLITETREALEQQTATAEVLGVINSSPGDLAPVFDAMLDKAMRLCTAAFGYLETYDGESFSPVAWRGLPARYAEYLPGRDRPERSGSYAQIVGGAPFVHVADLIEGEGYHASPLRKALVDLGGARTSILVALRRDEILLGSLVIYRQEVRPFSEKEIALLQSFAAQAVIAMENARLMTETREALEQQTATAEVLQVISQSTFDLEPVLQTVLDTVMRLCGNTQGMIFRLEDGVYRMAVSYGMEPAYRDIEAELAIRPGDDTLVGRTVLSREPVQIADPYADPAYAPKEDARVGKLGSMLGMPLLREGIPIGVICTARRRIEPFTEKQIDLVRTFADQAVIAIENARLLGELRQRTEEVAKLNRGLEARVASQLAELERTGKLRRFLAPQLADLIVAQGDESILESHRREIVVVFCDIRGFTAFAERAEPEEVMALLRDYHAALGPIVMRYEGTLDHYGGDGIMVFFNDPLPTPEPARRAIEMAIALREAAEQVLKTWRRHGHDLGFGVGISQGYATLGQIGFAERMDYTAIGTVTNLAARLCSEAKDGQILISRRVAVAVEDDAKLEEIGEVSLKGLSQAVAVYNVVQ
jgi:two-component system NtrC family sensor kinase